MREKTNNIKSHNIAREGIINNQRAATESMTVIDFQNQEIWLLKTKSWKLKDTDKIKIVIYKVTKKKSIFDLTFFFTKWDMS